MFFRSLATDKPFHIGLRETTLPYRGLIDELQLFDGELSAGDVAELANLKTPRSPIEWVRRSWPELADEQREQAKRWVRERIDLEHAKLITQRGDLEKEIRAIEQSAPGVMVLKEMVPPRETFVLKRGQYDQPTIKVSAGTPAVLRMEGVSDPKTRLEFADWLTHPKNPLAARVAVNRLWEQCFGVGLVRTSEDFGGSGEYPIHRELLDQLAQEFVRGGWDVRGMLRNIVLSSTYRQDSRLDPEQGAKDPENRLLGRGPRHRLSAEVIRDNALAISGLLVRKIGGPSVKPYQPPGLWEDVTVERRGKYVADSGEGLYRRSMYTFWKRTCPPPAMVTFDAPNREVCVARRSRTNTPLQALVLLNDPTYVEAARHFASDLVRSSDMDDFAKIQLAYRKALGREASFEEVAPIQSLLVEARRRFSEDQKRLSEFLAVGATPLATDLPATELGAWTVVCSMLLNLDETITKY